MFETVQEGLIVWGSMAIAWGLYMLTWIAISLHRIADKKGQ
jgi:hypothetical protein